MSETQYTVPDLNLARLNSFIACVDKLNTKVKNIKTNISDFSNRCLGNLNSKLQASSNKIKDFSGKFKEAATKIAESTKEIRGKIKDFTKESISLAENKVNEELRFKNNLELKFNVNSKQIKGVMKLFEMQQDNGVVGSDVQMAGAQQLANYVSDMNGVYKLIPSMNDFFVKQTGVTGTADEIKSTADIIGKALKGETEELEQAGIQLDEHQKKVLKDGSEQQKIAALKEALDKKVGGTNKQVSETDPGAIKRATMQYEAMKAKIGLMLLPFMAKFARWFSKNQPKIEAFISKIAAAVKKVFDFIDKHPKLTGFIVGLIAVIAIVIKIISFVKTIVFLLGLFGIAIDLGPILAFVAIVLAAVGLITLLITKWDSFKKAVAKANETPLIAKNSNTIGLMSDVNLKTSQKKKGNDKKKKSKDQNDKKKDVNPTSYKDALAYISAAQGDNGELYKSLGIPTNANNSTTENKNVTFGNINITAKGVTSKEVMDEIMPQLKLQLANI